MGQIGKRFRFQVLWVSDRTFQVWAQATTDMSMNGCSCVLIDPTLFSFFKENQTERRLDSPFAVAC